MTDILSRDRQLKLFEFDQAAAWKGSLTNDSKNLSLGDDGNGRRANKQSPVQTYGRRNRAGDQGGRRRHGHLEPARWTSDGRLRGNRGRGRANLHHFDRRQGQEQGMAARSPNRMDL